MNRTNSFAPGLMPILSAGRHRTPARGACFMEYASYLAGERWSDHPACTHPVLASLARDVNDLTTDAARTDLLPYVHRVVGLYPHDPRYAAEVAVLAACAALPVASLERQRALGAGLLSLVTRVGDARLTDLAAAAFAETPDAERWARQYLREAAVPRGSWERVAEAMVHTSVVGIALACIPDPDARLRDLLVAAIESAERGQDATTPARERALVAS